MKILLLIPYNPVNPSFGGALRVFHLLEHLTRHHDVTVAGFSQPDEIQPLLDRFPMLHGKTYLIPRNVGKHWRKWLFLRSLFSRKSHWHFVANSKKFQSLLNLILQHNEYDVIQSEFPDMADYEMNTRGIRILDAHNVEYDNFKRMSAIRNPIMKFYYRLESFKFYYEEIALARKQDAIFATSLRDIDLFKQDVPEKPMFLVPNGVDLNYFLPDNSTPEPNSIVFVGMMQYVPNVDGILYFLDTIFPIIVEKIPDIRLYIVGKNPTDAIKNRASKNVVVTGFVNDIRPYIRKATVYVIPLRMGGGTRLKMMEALSMRIPIVTTSLGCEGIDVVNGRDAIIEDDPTKFAEAVIDLLHNPERRNELVKNGAVLANESYGWTHVGKQMELAYSSLL